MGLGVVVVVGGCGHVGLPLGLLLAESGLMTIAYDIDERVVDRVRNEDVPFEEPGAATALKTMLASGRFKVSQGLYRSLGDCRCGDRYRRHRHAG
jgi:UDP-N-acetyl-D-mannosaminuronic acid dehydrogenase